VNDVAGKSSPLPSSARSPDGMISLGLGLTNECNLSCAFCYRDPARTDRLSLDQVKSVMERLPIRSVNLGTGENGMHPEFRAILAYLSKKPIQLTITSNGHSVAVLEENELLAFHDIEFSLDYPTQAEQDAQRGNGNWELIHRQAERCVRLGVPVTIIAVMMKANYVRLAEVARVAKRFDAPLRVNVYQAVLSRVLGGVRASFCGDRRDRDWRAAGSSHGRTPAARQRMRRKHGEGYAASHDPALRLLAGSGGAAVGFDLDGARHSGLCTLSAGPHASRRVPALRVSGLMSWWLCRPPAPSGRPARARLLLSDRSRRTTQPADPHGRHPRSAQTEQFLHYRSHCQVRPPPSFLP
jgi:organic radical activating enzyme